MKKLIVVIGIVVALVALGFLGLRIYTTQFSPKETARYKTDDIEISVTYSRPYKRDRPIFGKGNLVPFDTVWRTGANEATIFSTNKDLVVNGKLLKAGSYSLFTVPGEDAWDVIFNSETGQWGVDFSGKAKRDPENDVLTTTVSSIHPKDVFEQFTITFEQMGEEIELILIWDQTLVVVPMEPVKEN